MTRPLLSAVLLSLSACADLGPEYESNQNLTTSGATTSSITTSSTETASTETASTETSTFSPTEGLWSQTTITVDKNGCDSNAEKIKINMELTNTDASSFFLELVHDSTKKDFWECTTSDQTIYECTSHTTTYPLSDTFDATLYLTTTPGLQFYSQVSALMALELHQDCVGADCAYLSDLNGFPYPCVTELNLTLEHTGS